MIPTKFRFIWPSGSEEKIFLNQPIRNKNCLWRPCLLMDRDKMSILHRGPSIDASYQVSVHLAEGSQRRRLKCEKLTDDRRRMPSDGKSSHCLWQGKLKMLLFYIYMNMYHMKFLNHIMAYNLCKNILWLGLLMDFLNCYFQQFFSYIITTWLNRGEKPGPLLM